MKKQKLFTMILAGVMIAALLLGIVAMITF